MLRKPHSRGRHDFSDLCAEMSSSHSNQTLQPQSSLLSQPQLSITGSGSSLEESSRVPSFNAEYGSDHSRVTMKTRVAVRDKTPHRFQVVSLRDVDKLETWSANHLENSSRLGVSSTPNGTSLRPPSEKLGNQAKRLPSSSLKNCLDKLSKENLDRDNKTESVLDEISKESSLATTRNKSILKSGSPTSSSSAAVQQSHVLVELDTNVLDRRRFPPRTVSEGQVTSSIANLSSTESIIQLIRSESPLTHTISRSLQVRTRHERNHLKFSSLSNFQPPDVSHLTLAPTSKNRRVRTKSDAHIPSRFLDNMGAGGDSYYALLDAFDAVNPKSKKRHAIYTPSLYVPIFDQPCPFKENTDSSLDHTNWQCIPTANLRVDDVSPVGSQTIPRHKTPKYDIKVADDPKAPEYSPNDLSETGTKGPTDSLPITTRKHHLTHKSSSQRLHPRLPEDPNYSKALPKKRRPILSDPPQLSEAVYPQIVLDLLVDVDQAIEDWNFVY